MDNGGAQEIQWIWACKQPLQAIRANPALGAIEIAKGALGDGLPHKTLRVSRHHRMLVTSKIARRIYGAPEVLAAAKDLTAIGGIRPAPLHGAITYYHILMPRHEILFADGAMSESLYLGRETLHAIKPAAQNELRRIFGPMRDVIMITPPTPSRPMVQGKKLRQLIVRHLKNNKPLSNIALH
ncbi:MAG: hypothetical protein COB39_12940 [Marinosulfonomonas sp.]|nr:MAG: hypothetical protein COB39_12940 [Marinosulfonomonas sp.]